MKKLFAIPAWGLIFSVMACYMQDSRARAQASEEVELVQWRGGGGWNRGGGGGWHGGGGQWNGGGGWNRGGGGFGGAVIGGLIGGVIGGAFAPRPQYYQPQPYYVPQQQSIDPYTYCSQRFRSWNPQTGVYFGYDGQYHPCP